MGDDIKPWRGACAYLDVLGFRDLWKRTPDATGIVRRLRRVKGMAERFHDLAGIMAKVLSDAPPDLEIDTRSVVLSDGVFLFVGFRSLALTP